MDISDLMDHEIVKIGKVYHELQMKYGGRRNTRQNMDEFAKEAHDRFLKIGLAVEVGTTEALLGIGPPEITIVRRVVGSMEDKYGLDHEHKRWEILDSKTKGEDYRGQKESGR